jgi:hypothetical protein
MWMLLDQVAQSEVEDLDEVFVFWSEAAKDIPYDVESRCVSLS